MKKNNLIFTLIALIVLVSSVLMSCQLDRLEKEVAITGNDLVYDSLIKNPEFKKAIEEIDAKIESGELEIIAQDLSRDASTGVTITPAGSAIVLPGRSVTLTGTVNPNSRAHVFFWELLKNGESMHHTDVTYVNTHSVAISANAYGTGVYEFVCTAYTGSSIYILNSNKVSVTCTTWHTFTPTYSAAFSSNTYNAGFTFNYLSFPNSGSGIVTYNMTGGYQYKVSFSGSSNGGCGIYVNGQQVTGGYGTNRGSGSIWTSGNFKFDAGGTAGYKATLNNLVFQRAY